MNLAKHQKTIKWWNCLSHGNFQYETWNMISNNVIKRNFSTIKIADILSMIGNMQTLKLVSKTDDIFDHFKLKDSHCYRYLTFDRLKVKSWNPKMQRKKKVHLLKRAKIKSRWKFPLSRWPGALFQFRNSLNMPRQEKEKGNIEREMNNALLWVASARKWKEVDRLEVV